MFPRGAWHEIPLSEFLLLSFLSILTCSWSHKRHLNQVYAVHLKPVHLDANFAGRGSNFLNVSEAPSNRDLQKILTDLAALQSPNSIIRAANVRCTWEKFKLFLCVGFLNSNPCTLPFFYTEPGQDVRQWQEAGCCRVCKVIFLICKMWHCGYCYMYFLLFKYRFTLLKLYPCVNYIQIWKLI